MARGRAVGTPQSQFPHCCFPPSPSGLCPPGLPGSSSPAWQPAMAAPALESRSCPDSNRPWVGVCPQPGHPLPSKPDPTAGPPWPKQPVLVGPSGCPVLCSPGRPDAAGAELAVQHGTNPAEEPCSPSPCTAGQSSSWVSAPRCTPLQTQPASLRRSGIVSPAGAQRWPEAACTTACVPLGLRCSAEPSEVFACPSLAWVGTGV